MSEIKLDTENLFSAKGLVALVTAVARVSTRACIYMFIQIHVLRTHICSQAGLSGGCPSLPLPPPTHTQLSVVDTGIGLLIAQALAEAGAAKVYIVGRRPDVLEAAAVSIGKPCVVPVCCDVTSRASLEAAVATVEKDAGYLNLLVCNAGVGGPQVPPPAEHETLSEWRSKQLAVDAADYTQTFSLNATAVWYTTMSFLELLGSGNARANVEQSSQVIVISSIAAFNKKAPGGWVYGQSKAAATHLVKQLAIVLPQWDISDYCRPTAHTHPGRRACGLTGNVNE